MNILLAKIPIAEQLTKRLTSASVATAALLLLVAPAASEAQVLSTSKSVMTDIQHVKSTPPPAHLDISGPRVKRMTAACRPIKRTRRCRALKRPTSQPPSFSSLPFAAGTDRSEPAGASRVFRSAQSSYALVGWYRQEFSDFPGVSWIMGHFKYTALNCNLYDDWYGWWWWGNSRWNYYGGFYRHYIYSVGYEDTATPIC